MSWLVVGLLGCGVPSDEPISATAMISATEGGAVALEDGAVAEFPGGAFGEDTEVVLRRETCGGVFSLSAFAGCLYTVEAPGLLLPYALSVPTRTTDASQLVQGAADGLRPVFDGTASDGVASGTSAQPASFTARVASANPADDRCSGGSFVPCGGDLVGEWDFERGCGTMEQLVGVSWEGPDPYAACEPNDALVDYPFTVDGTLEFGSSGSVFTTTSGTVLKHAMVTMACLHTVGEACLPECAREGGVCDCVWPKADGNSAREGSWTYGADGMVVIEEVATPYCVDGEVLTVAYTDYLGSYTVSYRRR